jgi:nicotinamide-nucleotide amidase
MTAFFPERIETLAREVLSAARAKGFKIATAESCTGGLVAGALTEIPGSSDVFERGFSTYSNQAKKDVLGVPADLLKRHGAVSEPCARAMAEGALSHAPVQITVAITGIAGPGGGSLDKPAGLVHFAAARAGGATVAVEKRFGDIGRPKVRLLSVETALEMMLDAIRRT